MIVGAVFFFNFEMLLRWQSSRSWSSQIWLLLKYEKASSWIFCYLLEQYLEMWQFFYDLKIKINFSKNYWVCNKKIPKKKKKAGGGWYCGGGNSFINLCSENILWKRANVEANLILNFISLCLKP
jgi:hypothetical protein